MNNLKIKIKSFIASSLYNFMMIFHIKSNKIVVSNYYGLRGFSCNPKYIIEELLSRNVKYQIIWLVKDLKSDFPEHIKKIKYNSVRSLYHLATAKIWIDSQRKPIFVKKRKNQFYIQTWHGCFAMKKIEMDAFHSYDNKEKYLQERQHDSSMIDIFLSGADWFTELVKRAFLYNGKFLTYGDPRNDLLINGGGDVIQIRNKLNISIGSMIILYAPTFRNDETDLTPFNLDYEKILSELSEFYNKEIVLLIKLHPRLKKLTYNIKFSANIKSVTDYDDIQELLLISDILITDYSSCIFDFALQKKPGFIYASDIDDYKNDRNFYFNLYDLPFSVAQNTDSLILNIKNFDSKKYELKLSKYFNSVGCKQTGYSSKKVVDLIDSICDVK